MTFRDCLIIIGILCASRVALWLVCWFDRRGAGAAELSRKLLHVAMGLILCPLPWLFDRTAPVLALCGVYVALLIARRFLAALDNHVGGVIDGVGRRSVGEFLFPISVAIVFALARGDSVAYLAPILVLTLADAAAAVVGRRYGMCRYATPGGCKSLEGSLAFTAVAFASTHLTLLLAGNTGRVESVLLALVVALVLTVIEAFVTGGWDNLLVPLGAWGMLKLLAGLGVGSLSLLAGGAIAAVLALTAMYALARASAVAPPRGGFAEN
ncbi:MAG: phosphatidate cytidylyltransferase [Phycisphaerales bacterium]|nr:phosphatidate cytidylyltransferase [Phycisphaerales bacterium]